MPRCGGRTAWACCWLASASRARPQANARALTRAGGGAGACPPTHAPPLARAHTYARVRARCPGNAQKTCVVSLPRDPLPASTSFRKEIRLRLPRAAPQPFTLADDSRSGSFACGGAFHHPAKAAHLEIAGCHACGKVLKLCASPAPGGRAAGKEKTMKKATSKTAVPAMRENYDFGDCSKGIDTSEEV